MERWVRRIVVLAVSALVAAGLAGCGPEEYKAKTGGSEEAMKKVQSGQPLYTPPAGAPVPGAPK